MLSSFLKADSAAKPCFSFPPTKLAPPRSLAHIPGGGRFRWTVWALGRRNGRGRPQLLVSHTASPATASTPSSGTAELAAWVEAGLRCRDISLPDSDFRVTLCSSAETCRGVVHVHHHRRCSEDLPVSDDPATAAFLKTTCGPDAYEVKLLGPEVIVARPQYAGRCMAVARYELGAEGPHALVVRQLYGDYDAVSEYWDRRRPKWHAHYHRDKRIAQDMADVPCLHPTRSQGRPRLGTLGCIAPIVPIVAAAIRAVPLPSLAH